MSHDARCMTLSWGICASKLRGVWRITWMLSVALAAEWGVSPEIGRAQDPGRAQLSWQAPPGCPSQAHAREVLRDLLGAPASPTAPTALVQVGITHGGQSYAARIVFGGALRGNRELSGGDCAALANAVLLITALTIDPLAAADTITQTRREPRTPQRNMRVQVGLHMGADLGTLPRATVGPALEVGVEWGALRLSAEGTWWVPQHKLDPDELGGRMGLTEAGVRGCFELLRIQSVAAGPCAAFSGGPYWARGNGRRIVMGEHSVAPWAAARLGISVRQRSESVFLEASIEVGLPVVKLRYYVDYMDMPQKTIFESDWFGRVTLGFGWRL